MPREGYVVVSLTVEAKEKLVKLKKLINASSLSDAIIKVYELQKGLIELMSKVDDRVKKMYEKDIDQRTSLLC